MRKKTIEEELKEIQEEKEDHIAQLEKEFGHDKGHRYDFSVKNEKKKSKKQNFDFTTENQTTSSGSNLKEPFTYEDYKRMIFLEESDLSDEEFEEYCNLCDRFEDAPNKDELYSLEENEESANQHSDNFPDAKQLLEKIKSDREKLLSAKTENNNPAENNNLYKTIVENISASKRNHIRLSSMIFPILFLCLFVVAGFSVSIFAGIIPMTKYSNYVEVTATVQEIEDTWYDDGDLYARMVVSYVFKDQPITTSIKREINQNVQAGVTQFVVFVNPNNPTETRNQGSGTFIFPIIFGFVFAGFALLIQISLIVQAVKSKRH